MTNLELVYFLTTYPLSVKEHNELRKKLVENNLDYVFHKSKLDWQPELDKLLDGCKEIIIGDELQIIEVKETE